MHTHDNDNLTADQYAQLYRTAMARLEDTACTAEKAMRELEELYLSLSDGEKAAHPS